MRLMYPISLEGEQESSASPTMKKARYYPAFSRASHFTLLLVPVTVGVLGVMVSLLTAGEPVWLRVLCSFFMLLGLGAGMGLLHAVNQLEDWEESQND